MFRYIAIGLFLCAVLALASWWHANAENRALSSCRLLLLEGKADASLSAARELVAANPYSLPSIECLVRAHLALGQTTEAEKVLLAFRPSDRLSKGNVVIDGLKAEVAAVKAQAAEVYRKVAVRCQELKQSINEGKAEKIEAEVRQLANENPRHHDACELLALFNYYVSEDFAVATQAIEAAIKFGDEGQRQADRKFLSQILLTMEASKRIRELRESNQLREAMAAFLKLKQDGGFSFTSWAMGADILDGLGKTAEAAEVLEELTRVKQVPASKLPLIQGEITALRAKLEQIEAAKIVTQRIAEASELESEDKPGEAARLLLATAKKYKRGELALQAADIYTRQSANYEAKPEQMYAYVIMSAAALKEASTIGLDVTNKAVAERTAQGQAKLVTTAINYYCDQANLFSQKFDEKTLQKMNSARSARSTDVFFDAIGPIEKNSLVLDFAIIARPKEGKISESLILSRMLLGAYTITPAGRELRRKEFLQAVKDVVESGHQEIASSVLTGSRRRILLHWFTSPKCGISGYDKNETRNLGIDDAHKLIGLFRGGVQLSTTSCPICSGSGKGKPAKCPGMSVGTWTKYSNPAWGGDAVGIVRDHGCYDGRVYVDVWNHKIGKMVPQSGDYDKTMCETCRGTGHSEFIPKCFWCEGDGEFITFSKK